MGTGRAQPRRHGSVRGRFSPIMLLFVTAASLSPFAIGDAQVTPSLAVAPGRGPCDEAINVMLTGFPPNSIVRLDVARPFSDDVVGALDPATTDSRGSFTGQRSLGDAGCRSASIDAGIPPPSRRNAIEIFAGYDPDTLSVKARATYSYTTITTAPTVPPVTVTTTIAPAPAKPANESGGSDTKRWLLAASVIAVAALALAFGLLAIRRRRVVRR